MQAFRVAGLLACHLAGSVSGQGDAAAGQAKSALCATCHGADGNSAIAMNPKLAGQNASYLVKQLNDYKSGARVNATMAAMAAATVLRADYSRAARRIESSQRR